MESKKENPHSCSSLSKDNAMTGCGFLGGIGNKVYDGDGFDDFLNILDFPMESLEGDGLVEDWCAGLQGLGPIPSVLPEMPVVSQVDIGNGSSDMLPDSSVLNGRTSQLQQQPSFVEGISSSNIPLDSSNDDKSGVFQVRSPISVLSSSSSSSPAEKVVSAGPDITHPVRTRSKRLRRPNPWYVTSPDSSSDKISHPGRTEEKKKRKLSQLQGGGKEMKENSLELPKIATKKCTHCEITKTPQWREGPTGPRTLCNACGVRYRSGRLFPEYRPAASPTFVPSLHSNTHKKVIEMRNKALSEDIAMAETKPSVSPPPGFFPTSSYFLGSV